MTGWNGVGGDSRTRFVTEAIELLYVGLEQLGVGNLERAEQGRDAAESQIESVFGQERGLTSAGHARNKRQFAGPEAFKQPIQRREARPAGSIRFRVAAMEQLFDIVDQV